MDEIWKIARLAPTFFRHLWRGFGEAKIHQIVRIPVVRFDWHQKGPKRDKHTLNEQRRRLNLGLYTKANQLLRAMIWNDSEVK